MLPRPMLRVVGRRLDPEDHRLRDFLTRIAQPHEFHEAGTPDAEAVLAEAGGRLRDVTIESSEARGRPSR